MQNTEFGEGLFSSADKYFANPSNMIDKVMNFLSLQLYVQMLGKEVTGNDDSGLDIIENLMQNQVFNDVQVRMSFLIEMQKLGCDYWFAYEFEKANFATLKNSGGGSGWERVRSVVLAECMIFKGDEPGKNSCFKQCKLLITNKRIFVLDPDKLLENDQSINSLERSGCLLHKIDLKADVLGYCCTVRFVLSKTETKRFPQRHRL